MYYTDRRSYLAYTTDYTTDYTYVHIYSTHLYQLAVTSQVYDHCSSSLKQRHLFDSSLCFFFFLLSFSYRVLLFSLNYCVYPFQPSATFTRLILHSLHWSTPYLRACAFLIFVNFSSGAYLYPPHVYRSAACILTGKRQSEMRFFKFFVSSWMGSVWIFIWIFLFD